MKIILMVCVYLFFQHTAVAQPFTSPGSISAFANYLYCKGEFQRARDEYSRLPEELITDTIRLAKATALLGTGAYQQIADEVLLIKNSQLRRAGAAALGIAMAEALSWDSLRFVLPAFHHAANSCGLQHHEFDLMLAAGSTAFDSLGAVTRGTTPQIDSIAFFHSMIRGAGSKSPVAAAFLSALIPGAGKIYTGEYGDGITAFIFTGLLTGIAVSNFNAGHTFRAWLFTALASSYYAGTIYGSAASAVVVNEKERFDASWQFREYASSKNFFLKVDFAFPCP